MLRRVPTGIFLLDMVCIIHITDGLLKEEEAEWTKQW